MSSLPQPPMEPAPPSQESGAEDQCPRCGAALEADGCLACSLEMALTAGPDGPDTFSSAYQVVAQLPLPRNLGGFRLEEELGRGGMGVVYRARDLRLQRTVAVKVLPPRWLVNEKARQRFLREMVAAAQLNHPNIATAYHADEDKSDRSHFLVLEFVDGTDLDQRVREDGPLREREAVRMILHAARGLASAHREGVVHRDVKPANLILASDGTVKILDFGLARFESERALQEVAAGAERERASLLGTLQFMAPEQTVSPDQADERSDIYALGATLFFLLTGRPACPGTNREEIVQAHQAGQLRGLTGTGRGASPAIARLYARMTATDPAQRFQSMEEVIGALERLSAGFSTRKRSALLAVAAVLALAAVAFGSLWWRGSERPAPPTASPPAADWGELPLSGISSAEGVAAGTALAGDDNYRLVGAPGDQSEDVFSGAAYLLDAADGELLARIDPPQPEPELRFGFHLALDGQRALIGAPSHLRFPKSPGSAFLYDLSVSPPALLARLTAPEPVVGDHFGITVALNDRWAVVGMPDDYSLTDKGGSAFLYDLTGESPRLVTKLTPSDIGKYSYFGRSVALHGSLLAVGAPGHGDPPGSDYGAVYLFDLATSPPQELSKIVTPTPSWGSCLGNALAIRDRHLLIGAHEMDYDRPPVAGVVHPNCGAAFLYDLSNPRAPILQHKLMPPKPEEQLFFGESLALTDRFAAVSAPGQSPEALAGAGGVHLFDLETGIPFVVLHEQPPRARNHFGSAFHLGSADLLVGAPGQESGRVHRLPLPWSPDAVITPDQPVADLQFGAAMAAGGNLLAVSGQTGPVSLYDLDTHQKLTELLVPESAESDWKRKLCVDADSRVALGVSSLDDPRTGVVYLYEVSSSPSPHRPTRKLTPPGGGSEPTFGASLALDSGRCAVLSKDGAEDAIYLYDLSASEPALVRSFLLPPDRQGKFDAHQLLFFGETLLCGVSSDDGAGFNTGALLAFDCRPGAVSDPVVIRPPDLRPDERFGHSLAISGKRLFVSSPWRSHPEFGAQAGHIRVYDLAASPPREIRTLSPPATAAGGFGNLLAAHEETLLAVGAEQTTVVRFDHSDPAAAPRTHQSPLLINALALTENHAILSVPQMPIQDAKAAGAVLLFPRDQL